MINAQENQKLIFAYNPPGIKDISLIKSVIKNGGIGLIDLDRLDISVCENIVDNCQSELQNNWGIRVTHNKHLELLARTLTNPKNLNVIIGDFSILDKEIALLKKFGCKIIAEVISLKEAKEKNWADLFIVKGHEAGGRIGDETSFILAQQFAKEKLPFVIQGGMGLYTSAAVMAIGSKGIVLDTQLYLTKDCPLPNETKEFLKKIDATDTKVIGNTSAIKYRVFAKLGTKIVNELIKKEKSWLNKTLLQRTKLIKKELNSSSAIYNSNNITNSLLPIGQDIAFVKEFSKRFSNVKEILDYLFTQSSELIKKTKENYPFFENNEVAKQLGIKLPIAQGPMANISENPKFAKKVSDAGALPFLALGSLFKNQTKNLIKKTKETLKSKPFGCGIIGLEANKERRDEHFKILEELKPKYAVIAAGTIDQAIKVNKMGIETFLHAPSPAILAEAIKSGVYHLVLEGMECGGHIGVLTSFVLWELSLYEIAKIKESLIKNNKKVILAFAGGIADSISTTIVSILTSVYPKIISGILWVGSAYIFTKEIIDTKAIKPLYQKLALEANETIVMGETVNTRARSIPTPCAQEIVNREIERIENGLSLKDRKHFFEKDNLGSTRIAALGEIWNPDGEDDKPNRFKPVDRNTQYKKGNYLIGQVVANLDSVITINSLHKQLIIDSKEIIDQTTVIKPAMKESDRNSIKSDNSHFEIPGEGVAVVGLGCVFPDAPNINAFWQNIINKKSSIREITKKRWGDKVELFYHPDKKVPDKSYAKIAAFIDDFKFNSLEFKIPPHMASHIGLTQKLALVAAKEALADANLLGKEVDNSRTAVIIGNAMGDEIRIKHTRRVYVPEILETMEHLATTKAIDDQKWSNLKNEVIKAYNEKLPQITEDSMPGALSNVIAGRISNNFNLRGKNMTTDAACASSLAALNVAVKGLLDKEYDAVLCGGSDCSLDPPTFVKFSKIGALSADGSFPFDKRAAGFVMGEGAGFCVLKRLSDAKRDGDKIYAVIRGMGSSSDGKGKGITAPNPLGQKLAIQRALEQAQLHISEIDLIEAHGTSTKVGDVIELEVLNDIAKDCEKSSIAIGSIKSQIGHLKSAAGIASLIKAVLALHHKIVPPSINFETPNPNIDWKNSAFYVNTEPEDWKKQRQETRKVGVSSFGFGGTNYHTILEEYKPELTRGMLPRVLSPIEITNLQDNQSLLQISSGVGDFEEVFNYNAWQEYLQRNLQLETEAIFIGSNSKSGLEKEIEKLLSSIPISDFQLNGQGIRIRDLANDSVKALNKKYRIALTCKTFDELKENLTLALEGLKNKNKRLLLRNKGIFYSEDHTLGKIAFLFPGQGSQYLRMGRELYDKFEIVRETFKEGDEITQELMGIKISDVIFVNGKSDEEAKELLKETEYTQPAIFVVNIAIFRLLQKMGIKPDFVAGHSLGEYAALVASGIFNLRDALSAVIPRGKAMAKFFSKDKGKMASIAADYKTVNKILKQVDGYVIAANKNSLKQTVISGESPAIKQAMKLFAEKGITAILLPVSAAFHSKIVAPAVDTLRDSLEKIDYKKQVIPITSNVTGEIYPTKRNEIIDLLCEQISSPVEWIKQITKMYEEDNVRTFIEIGPKYVLTSFTKGILEDKNDYVALASNHPKRGAMQHFSETIAAMGAYGGNINFPKIDDDSFYTSTFLHPAKQFFEQRIIPKQQIKEQIKIQKSPFDALITNDLGEIVKDDEFQDYLELQAPAITAFLKAGYETYKQTIAKALKTSEKSKLLEITTEELGITGISIGLPGKNREVFDPNNFDAILAGENFIEQIPVEIRDRMVDKNIVRLVKDAIKGAQFQSINDVSEVIKLAAQKGKFDLSKDYGVKAEFADLLDITFQLSFAAGIEALKDAGIPLTPQKVKTSIGKEITKGWALPEELRDETGIIFASAFPAYSNLISIISDYLSDKYINKTRVETIGLFEELISKVSHKPTKQKIEQWFNENKDQLSVDKESQFEFSRKFLFEILSMGHSQFAQFIRARGPNTQVNAACSSTTQAISIAEDWIRTGRCKRVIVIAADDVTNEQMLEWIGSGFLAVGAATTKKDVKEAALPFDKRRHGMIIGMGAVGLIIESETAMAKRGIKPIVDILGTHIVNSAFHGTRLDRAHISSQMDLFISKIEQRYNISRDEIAEELVFVSHETYTPARGGSASAEVDALRKTFGKMTDKIVIANTKGFTGHAMGAGIEDVVAVKILENGIVPPVANWKELDPELGQLNLSKGGQYDVKYALRFAAGFGSQLTLALFRLNTKSDRMVSKTYDTWLNAIGGSRSTLEIENRTLRLLPDPTLTIDKPKIDRPQDKAVQVDNQFSKVIIDLIVEKTGYPADMIEANMHLEEDLGIDTVKQAELFGQLRAKYELPREDGVRIQDYYSVNKIAEYLSSRVESTGSPKTATQDNKTPIIKAVLDLIVEKTGYPVDMIEPDMELEEDLGIDTVKQAEMFGIIREKWNLPREEGIRIQDYSTVNKIADYILSRISESTSVPTKEVIEQRVSSHNEFVPAKRLALQLIKAPLPKIEKLKLKGKKFIIACESNQFSSELISLLKAKKAQIVKLLDLKKLKTRENIIKQLPTEEIDGLIYIEPKTSKKNKHDLTARILFSLCREINYSESPIIAVISITGTSFGWTGHHPPISGSLTGFTKSISREFSNSNIKCISCVNPKHVIKEIMTGDGSIEVSYSEKGRRSIFITKESPIKITDQPFVLSNDDLLLITGGALGITYEITKEIAKKYQPKLALVGIEQLIDNIDEIVTYDSEKLTKLKEQLISDLKQKHERVTPVQIDKEWSKITKAIDIKKALQYLSSVGCEARYYSANVINSELMTSTIEKIMTDFNQEITGIIHGAGLEISRLIADKKPEEFDLVYNVKTIGLDNLIQNINLKKIKFIKCFSSVAGRFGNAGQVDYSSANDYLSKNCWQFRKKGIRATSICWSAWGEVGMATRGSIMKVLKQVGVTPISVNDGVKAFMNELEFGTEPEVVIVGKMGALLKSPSNYVQVDRKQYPLVGKMKRNFDGSISTIREFTLEDDLYLNHHRFDNVPFLPGVIGLEIFAELAKLVKPKAQLVGYQDVEFKSAIKFNNDKPRILKAHIDSTDSGLECSLISEFIKDGVVVGKPTIHFKAKVILGKRKEEASKKPKLKDAALANKKVIYTILPHGPLFQVLKEINDVNEEIITKALINSENHFNFQNKGFVSLPLEIESGFQSMGLLDIIKENKLGLPLSIKSLVINKAIDPPVYIRGTKLKNTEFGSLYNFEILTKSGQVVLKADEYSTALVDFGADLKNAEEIKMQKVKRLFKLPKDSSLEVVKVDRIKAKIKSDPEYLNNYLHSDEKEKLKSIKIEKRKIEWLTGIIAAKKTLKLSNPKIDFKDILIQKTSLGKPFVKINGKIIPLSISHSNDYAIAIINGSKAIGIDLEQIESRDDSFVQEMLSPTEYEYLKNKNIELTNEMITKIWTAKEAVLKALGIGLNIDLHYLKISSLKSTKFVLNLEISKIHEKIRSSIPELKGKSKLNLEVSVSANNNYAAALCFIN